MNQEHGELVTKGQFISFEGADGSGKTTASKLFAQELERLGVPVLWTREPGGTEIGAQLRELILNNAPVEGGIHGHTQLLMLLADRNEHLRQVVYPNTQRGVWVVTDRFIDSTYVLQGRLGGMANELAALERVFPALFARPDLTVLMSCSDETCAERAHWRGTNALDEHHAKSLDVNRKLHEHFSNLVVNFGVDSIVTVDANRELDQVSADVIQMAKKLAEAYHADKR